MFRIADKSEVFNVWSFVWSSDLNRAYTADFELYKADGSVEIFVALK